MGGSSGCWDGEGRVEEGGGLLLPLWLLEPSWVHEGVEG